MKCLKKSIVNNGVGPVALVEVRPVSTWGWRSGPGKHSGLEERIEEP